MHAHTRAHAHAQYQSLQRSLHPTVCYVIFFRQSLEINGQFHILHVRQSSDRSMHQPTRNHNGDIVAEKRTSDSDDDMDITQCLSSSIVTSNVSTSEVRKKENSYSIHSSVPCNKEPESLDICSTKEGTVLKHKKKPRTRYNGDSSDESVLDEEWKPSKNRIKNSKQRKARSAKMKCKSFSRGIKTRSTTAAEESQITR